MALGRGIPERTGRESAEVRNYCLGSEGRGLVEWSGMEGKELRYETDDPENI